MCQRSALSNASDAVVVAVNLPATTTMRVVPWILETA